MMSAEELRDFVIKNAILVEAKYPENSQARLKSNAELKRALERLDELEATYAEHWGD